MFEIIEPIKYSKYDIAQMMRDTNPLSPGLYLYLTANKEPSCETHTEDSEENTVENQEENLIENPEENNKTKEFFISHKSVLKELYVTKNTLSTSEHYSDFALLDFYSSAFQNNKLVDVGEGAKKVSNINPYALFLRMPDPKNAEENTVDLHSVQNIEMHAKRFFKSLKNWATSGKNKPFFKKCGAQIKMLDVKDIEKYEEIIISKIPIIVEYVKQYKLGKNDYIKVFLDVPIEDYITAYRFYLFPSLFAKNNMISFNDNNELVGPPAANFTLNTNKPFICHPTTKYKVPMRVSLEEAKERQLLIKWLGSQKDEEKNFRVPFGYLPLIYMEKSELLDKPSNTDNTGFSYIETVSSKQGPMISDYDILPIVIDSLTPPLEIKNYLDLPVDKAATRIMSLPSLENIIHYTIFSGLLKQYYYRQPKTYKNEEGETVSIPTIHVNAILTFRPAMINYFKKYDNFAFIQLFDRISLTMVLELFKKAANETINLEYSQFARALINRFSILEYYKIGGNPNMGNIANTILNNLRTRIADKNKQQIHCESDAEFYFGVGQVARYLASQSKAQKATYDLIRPIMKAGTAKEIKRALNQLLEKFAYAINVSRSDKKSAFEKAHTMLMSYEPDSKEILLDMLLAGFGSPNIIWEIIKSNSSKNNDSANESNNISDEHSED